MASSGRSYVKFLILLAVLAAGAAGFVYYRRTAAEAKAPEFTTTTVSRGDITQVVTATGTLDAVLSVDVGSQISGQIKELFADFNTPVKAGQKLVEIDPATYDQRVRQAQADLASADANYTLNELNAKRTQELFEKKLVTAQENDQAQALLKQAKSTLQTKQAALDNAKVDLSRCTIFSPIDGVVISKQTEVGKTVAASMNVPVLFTIANDLAKMQITAAVAEADIGAVEVGQAVTFTADAFPNRTFRGTVTQVRNAPKTVSNVVTYDTIISVENRDLKLRPGMTANVSIIVQERPRALKVANAALRVRIPEGLEVRRPVQEAKAGAPAAPAAESEGRRGGGEGGAGGRGGGGMRGFFANLTPEQREKLRAINAEVGVDFRAGPPTPEQREQIRKLMVERGVITADQAAEMAGGRAGTNAVVTRTVYRLPGGNANAVPEAVSVKVGITDGLASEILDGVKEGDVLITSVTLPNGGGAPAGRPNNPFAGGRRF
ncbi:MAG TPA: efflux RND transporter periplasmic adaptor subunit [Lacunisphaera sp.]|jgi:HlyD family secretion protein|nr:efflux RND transporter periplasmic adaptor subunit [Lacunisphaera sp.]